MAELSSEHQTLLGNDISGNTATIEGIQIKDLSHTTENAFHVANWYNGVASPDFWVWKSTLTKKECVIGTSVDGTTFTWAGNGFITRSVQELLCWQELFDTGCDPSQQKTRDAFADIFSGAGNAASNRTHLLAVARKKASRAQKLLATGTGTTGNPAVMGHESAITLDNIRTIWGI